MSIVGGHHMDSAKDYKDSLAYWAASCAMDGIQMDDELPSIDDAESHIEGVWDFVVESCGESELTPPPKNEAIEELKEMIASYLVDMTE
jgi:predicted RNase H-like HicB family nuclease